MSTITPKEAARMYKDLHALVTELKQEIEKNFTHIDRMAQGVRNRFRNKAIAELVKEHRKLRKEVKITEIAFNALPEMVDRVPFDELVKRHTKLDIRVTELVRDLKIDCEVLRKEMIDHELDHP